MTCGRCGRFRSRSCRKACPEDTRARRESLEAPSANAAIFAAARELAQEAARPSALRSLPIDAVEAGTKLPFEEGCKIEQKLFNDCLFSNRSKALIHLFFQRARGSRKSPDIPKDTPPIPVSSVAALAAPWAAALPWCSLTPEFRCCSRRWTSRCLIAAWPTFEKNYTNSVKRGRFTQQLVEERLKLIKPVLVYDGFGAVDMVVEAVLRAWR